MERVKQKVALLLMMVLTITHAIPVIATAKPLLLTAQERIQLKNGEDAKIALSLINNSANEQTAHLIVALYNTQTHAMVDYHFTIETVASGQSKDWTYDMPIPDKGLHKVKVFAWDNMDSPTLLSNIIEVTQEVETEASYKKILDETSAYLASQTPDVLQTVGGEWRVFGLARSEYPVDASYYADYISRVEERVLEELQDTSRPFDRKVTETQRLAIALSALGQDVSSVAGNVNLFDYTWHKEKHFPMLNPPMNMLGGMQGINEFIFGLLTIDIHQQEPPVGATVSRESIIESLLAHQKAEGGFGLSQEDTSSSVDITAMALQALAPYKATHPSVEQSIEKALQWLSLQQSESGGFRADTTNGSETSESTAQVLVALSTLGIDGTKDSRFIKGSNNPLTNLLSYYAGEGMFRHTLDGEPNQMGTEQSHYALVAYDRLLQGKTSLYDLSDVMIEDVLPESNDTMIDVSITIDRSSIGTDAVLADMGHNTVLEDTQVLKVPVGSTVLDVLNTFAQTYDIAIDLKNNYLQVLDKIGEFGTEAFDRLIQDFGLESVPEPFMTSGWMYEVNGKEAQVGIGEYTVQPQDEITFRMALYWGQDAEGNWVKHDWQFIDAYNALDTLYASIDLDLYSGDQLQRIAAAQEDARAVLDRINQDADGKWFAYIGTLKEKLFGEDSPTENLVLAYKTLEQALLEEREPLGEVSLAIEKRTIGKGDTLSQTQYPYYEGDTAWHVIERAFISEGITYEIGGTVAAQNIYIASIDGDGEFDFGSGSGWKYEVNGVFPDVSVVQYPLQSEDVIRLRYTTTVSGTELQRPLVELLTSYVEEAKGYHEALYTPQSHGVLKEAIQKAEAIIANPAYASTDASIEIEVSLHIRHILDAIAGLVENEDHVTAPSEIPDDFINNISLNHDFMKIKVGETYQIVARRLEEIVDNPIDNIITHPRYNYEVISGNSVTVDSNGLVKATQQGTSVIAVTYDKLTSNGKTYGAISDVNTGLFVVHVADGTDTGIRIAINNEQNHIVDETRSYDTYYFLDDYFNYQFSVDAFGADSVVVLVNNEIVTPDNGIYTAQLENKGNIIQVIATNDIGSETFAQVIDARKIEIEIFNTTDPTRHDDIQVGDKIEIAFRGITLPVYKLATIYNPSFDSDGYDLGDTAGAKVAYTSEKTGEVLLGKATQWDLAHDNAITFIAEEVGTYHFSDGHIDEGWWGSPLGTEKMMNGPFPEGGLGSAHHHDKFSQLPEFSITVNEKPYVAVEGIAITNAPESLEIISGNYPLEVKITPSDASVDGLIWTSDDTSILKVSDEGVLTPVGVGRTTIKVRVANTIHQTFCDVTITPELPATADERLELKAMIEQAKGLDESLYTSSSWSELQDILSEAIAIFEDEASLLDEVRSIHYTLQRKIETLHFDPSLDITTPQGITVGSEVTIYMPNLHSPEYEGFPVGKEIKTVYESDIPGLAFIKTANAFVNNKIDNEILRTLTFVIPETTTPGVYTLKNGRLEARSFMPSPPIPDFQIFLEDDMPILQLVILAKEDSLK